MNRDRGEDWTYDGRKKISDEEFIFRVGELLKETRYGADIDHAYLDQEGWAAVIVYRDPRRIRRRVSLEYDSRTAMISDMIRAITEGNRT